MLLVSTKVMIQVISFFFNYSIGPPGYSYKDELALKLLFSTLFCFRWSTWYWEMVENLYLCGDTGREWWKSSGHALVGIEYFDLPLRPGLRFEDGVSLYLFLKDCCQSGITEWYLDLTVFKDLLCIFITLSCWRSSLPLVQCVSLSLIILFFCYTIYCCNTRSWAPLDRLFRSS